ncbi:MAG TPA: hypothetical protein VFI97_03650 [Arthrobacter sp.]|nr:hypothetical protein [Arthrobacter sp.]
MADAVQETKHGFFASPVGIVILSVLSTSMAALAFALFRKIPKIFERVDGINSALMGEPARPEYGIPGRKGVIKQVEELQSSQHALEEHVTEQIDALKRQMQRELAAIRRGLRMRGEHEHD